MLTLLQVILDNIGKYITKLSDRRHLSFHSSISEELDYLCCTTLYIIHPVCNNKCAVHLFKYISDLNENALLSGENTVHRDICRVVWVACVDGVGMRCAAAWTDG